METLYTVKQIARAWHMSLQQATRLFETEPGVVNISAGNKNRALRIPASVVERVRSSRTTGCGEPIVYRGRRRIQNSLMAG